MLVGVFYIFGQEAYLQYQKNSLQDEINRNREMVNKDKSLSNEITLTKAHISKAKELESLKSKSTDELLNDLSSNIPTGVVFQSLNYSKEKITVTGTASSKEEIESLWANLRESEKFLNSYITSITEGEGKLNFNLDITLGGEKINGEN